MKHAARQHWEKLLGWYDQNRRTFPWRAPSGATPDPYRVWLSEIMLQQTGTASVIAYFNKFMARWPDVRALAHAELDEVLTEWAGLGYYARARNLHRCANIISKEMNGAFPRELTALEKLPGIGPYTAASIAAIAFDEAAPVLDGNIERVLARLYAVTDPLPGAKRRLREHSHALLNHGRPGDAAQAMMDLGATICKPRKPDCPRCPWQIMCAAHRQNMTETLPVKQRRAKIPTRRGAVFWLLRHDGAVLLRRRPEKGLLGGMMEFPGTPWTEETPEKTPEETRMLDIYMPVRCGWRALPGAVRHVFTHFRLDLTIYAAQWSGHPSVDGIWVLPETFSDHALPTVMRKVAAHVRQSMKAPAA